MPTPVFIGLFAFLAFCFLCFEIGFIAELRVNLKRVKKESDVPPEIAYRSVVSLDGELWVVLSTIINHPSDTAHINLERVNSYGRRTGFAEPYPVFADLIR